MRILIVGASSGIGRGPALGGIPSSKESLIRSSKSPKPSTRSCNTLSIACGLYPHIKRPHHAVVFLFRRSLSRILSEYHSHIHTFTQKCRFILILPPKSAYFCLKWHISLQKFVYVKKFLYLCTQIWCKDERRSTYRVQTLVER